MDMLSIILTCILISFLTVLITAPRFIKNASERGLVGIDMHKPNKPEVPEFGGIVIIVGYVAGMLLALILLFTEEFSYLYVLASLCAVIIAAFVGIVDDLLNIKWRTKVLTPLIASLPLTVVRAGEYTMTIPFIGPVDFGLIYPIVLVPLAITGAANAVNMLASYNGLEAGGTLIVGTTILAASLIYSRPEAGIVIAPMIGACSAFLVFNRYPSRIFPGDSGTFAMGAAIASAVIVGNLETIGLTAMGPYFLHFGLFMLGRIAGVKRVKFAEVDNEGHITPPHKFNLLYLIASIKKFKEWQIVIIIYSMLIVSSLIALSI
jgi:UDP-N-acetylglucosamine--dolichyl-phosphate N-acetylglucosaminephosphotransferase